MKKYYIAVCVPSASGGWRAVFPDAPDCGADGSTLDRTVFHAADALAGYAARLNGTAVQVLQAPRDLTTIRADQNWEAANKIDWSAAVITMIPLSLNDA
jgi:predicted RNase H-like HicB family nuclease